MNNKITDVIYRLTGSIVFLMILCSVLGLILKNLYTDNLLIKAAWFGNDLVTLFIVVPFLMIAMYRTKKGSSISVYFWMGLICYSIYNYCFYLFGASFNYLFIIYALITVLAIYTLISILLSIKLDHLKIQLEEVIPQNTISVFTLLVVSFLSLFYIYFSINFIINNEIPFIITNFGLRTNIIGAMDLLFVIPTGFLGGIWLLMNKPLGYLIVLIWNIKGLFYMPVLILGSIFQAKQLGHSISEEIYIWIFILLGCLVTTFIMVRNID